MVCFSPRRAWSRVLRVSAGVLAFTALLASPHGTIAAQLDDDDAVPFTPYTMKAPAGWDATDIPSPTMLRCIDASICGAKSIVIIRAHPAMHVPSTAELTILAPVLRKIEEDEDGAFSARVGSTRGYPAIFLDRPSAGAHHTARAVALVFAGKARIMMTSSAPDLDHARRTLETFLAAIVFQDQAP